MPTDLVSNARNDIYLIGEALKLIDKKQLLPMEAADLKAVTDYHKAVDNATKFIPLWVKVAVALALGLGTMVGWKRIVVTVGEKIGKSHLTYGQGAAAELVAMVTIGMADRLGPAGVDNPRAVVGRRRNDGRQRLGTAMGDGAQPAACLGADAALLDHARLRAVHRLPPGVLSG